MAIDLKNTVGGEKNGQGGLTRQETDCRRTNVADESLDRAQCISSPSEGMEEPEGTHEHRHEDGAEAATPIAIGPPGVEHGQEERQNEWRDCEKLRADRRITECLDDCSAIRRLLAAV